MNLLLKMNLTYSGRDQISEFKNIKENILSFISLVSESNPLLSDYLKNNVSFDDENLIINVPKGITFI